MIMFASQAVTQEPQSLLSQHELALAGRRHCTPLL